MDDGDKLAIATLASGRCAALGKLEPADYVAAFIEIEQLFRKYRDAEGEAEAEAIMKTLEDP
jgi:hypothetical protein